jgi:hypothetical protein
MFALVRMGKDMQFIIITIALLTTILIIISRRQIIQINNRKINK